MYFFSLKAKDELNETDERRASSLKDLRTMMKERAAEGDDLGKLVLERFGDKPDSLLLRFLRARKFDVGRAHELMKGEEWSTFSFMSITSISVLLQRYKLRYILPKVSFLPTLLRCQYVFDPVSGDIFQ